MICNTYTRLRAGERSERCAGAREGVSAGFGGAMMGMARRPGHIEADFHDTAMKRELRERGEFGHFSFVTTLLFSLAHAAAAADAASSVARAALIFRESLLLRRH